MDEVAVVGRLQTGGDLSCPLAGPGDGLRPVVVDEVFEVSAGDEFEYEIMHLRVSGAGRNEGSRIERGHHVGMVDGGQCLHLGTEALQEFRRDGLVHGKHLDRDAPLKQDVLAEEDHRCAAAAEAVEDAIAPEDEPRRISADNSFALVFGEQSGVDERGGGALARGEPRQFVRRHREEVLDRGDIE